jgi:hypothetical protein
MMLGRERDASGTEVLLLLRCFPFLATAAALYSDDMALWEVLF